MNKIDEIKAYILKKRGITLTNEQAAHILFEMECGGLDFSECSQRAYNKEILYCWDLINHPEYIDNRTDAEKSWFLE